MQFTMFRIILTKLKIFGSIIGRFIVNMMNPFFGFKIATNNRFHYKAVFINISRTISKGMVDVLNKDIFSFPFSSNGSSSLPTRTIFSRTMALGPRIGRFFPYLFHRITHRFSLLYRVFPTSHRNTKTFIRAIFCSFRSTRFCLKRLVADYTLFISTRINYSSRVCFISTLKRTIFSSLFNLRCICFKPLITYTAVYYHLISFFKQYTIKTTLVKGKVGFR